MHVEDMLAALEFEVGVDGVLEQAAHLLPGGLGHDEPGVHGVDISEGAVAWQKTMRMGKVESRNYL